MGWWLYARKFGESPVRHSKGRTAVGEEWPYATAVHTSAVSPRLPYVSVDVAAHTRAMGPSGWMFSWPAVSVVSAVIVVSAASSEVLVAESSR